MHFGASLRVLRVHRGLSLRDLAAEVGVSAAYLSRVEHGHDAPPTADRLLALARSLGASGELLLALAGRPLHAPAEATLAADVVHREVLRRRLTPAQLGRVLEFIAQAFPATPLARPAVLAPLLSPARVQMSARVTTLDDAVDLAALRITAGADAPGLADALRAAAAAGAGVGGGLAIPHTGLGPPGAALVLLSEPLAAATPDGAPLRALLAITGVPAGPAGLGRLGAAAQLATPACMAALGAAVDADEVVRLVQLFEGA